MKKVLFVATVDSFIELFLLPYLKIFKEKGYEVHVATDTKKEIEYCDKKIQLSIKRSPFKFFNNYKAVRELEEVAKREQYEILHCHTPMGGVVARLAARKMRRHGTRVIYTAHGFHFYTGAPLHYWLMFYPVEKYLAKYTDTLITINLEDYNRARKKFGKRCRDIQYVPGVGVKMSRFTKKMSASDRTKYRKLLGFSEDDKIIMCNGRLDKNKNQGFLIRAMEKIVKKDPSYHLLLVGTDEIGGKYQKLALSLGLTEHVHFLGFHKDIPELLQISDVLVSVSKREGLPLNLIEAAFMGVPVVVSDCRGNRDICKSAGGTLVKQGDMERLVRGIMKACEGAANEKHNDTKVSMDQYTFAKVSEMMVKIYERKKRVLHVLASDRYSGAENVACTIISNLSDEYEMAYCSPDGPIRDILKERDISYYGLKKLNFKELKNVVFNYNPDIIHAHDFRASVIASRFGNSKMVISHIHKNDPKMKRISVWSLIYRYTVSKYEKIIWVSKEALQDSYFYSIMKEKSIVLKNVIDERYIKEKSGEYKLNKKYDLVFVGRLIGVKNPKRALRIILQIKEQREDVSLALIGDGYQNKMIHDLVTEYGLEKNVEMFGFKKNPYPIISNSKIMLITSRNEGLPMVILEAFCLGKPVISTKINGFERVIHNDENGYISDDNEKLVNKIIEYLDNKRYEMLSKKTGKIFSENNNIKEYIRILSEVYSGWSRSDEKGGAKHE